MSAAVAGREVLCPRCSAPSLFAPTNRWRPFCSERCANIDLGAWASEAYRVDAREEPGDERESPMPPVATGRTP